MIDDSILISHMPLISDTVYDEPSIRQPQKSNTPFPNVPCVCCAKSISKKPVPLRTGLLLLLLPQRRQTNSRDLDDLESNTGNITLRLALTTETSEEDFIVLVDEVEATIVGHCILQSAIVQIVSPSVLCLNPSLSKPSPSHLHPTRHA